MIGLLRFSEAEGVREIDGNRLIFPIAVYDFG